MAKETQARTDGAAEVRRQLERILASPGFQGAERRSKLLRYLVEQSLADSTAALKESVIASEVFNRAADYDPQVDSIVRVEVGRLRSRLAEYYGQAGVGAPLRIEIPKGGYRPLITFRPDLPEIPPEIPVESAPPEDKTGSVRPRSRLAAAALVALALAGLAWWAVTRPPAAPSIAVLPFLNLSGDPANEYLGDGISDEITENLAQHPDLRVVARTSAFQFKGKNVDVREIGRRLSAGAVLEGSVGRRGDQFHLVAQLIRARDGYLIWSASSDGGASDLPAWESHIVQSICDKLGLVDSREAHSGSPEIRTAANPEAHDLYLRANLEFSRRTVEGTREAMRLAREASEKDPTYAAPFVLMAAAESQLATLLVKPPHEAAEREREDIVHALALDPTNVAAHGVKAMLDYVDEWNWPQAEREFRTALAQGSHGSVENLYGWCLMTRGRFAEARRHLQIAAELDPLSLGPQLNQVEELTFEANLPAAKAKVQEILGRAPHTPVALAEMLLVGVFQRDCKLATSAGQELLTRYERLPFSYFAAFEMDGACGREEKAASDFAQIMRNPAALEQSPYAVAEVLCNRGETDRALAYLNQSADRREPVILYLKIDHLLDTLRKDPRFTALERRVGLLD